MRPFREAMQDPLVSIVIVNWNSGDFLSQCLGALAGQTYAPLEVIIVDNGSSDASLAWASTLVEEMGASVIQLGTNTGFAPAFNRGYALSHGECVLSLNADVRLEPDAIAGWVGALARHPEAGLACGKLWRDKHSTERPLLDSTGLFLSRARRPYDRGGGEEDVGQYDRAGEVFGACGAAWAARRAMLEDVRCLGELLDEDFFAYYDDADLSWRARLRGWTCWYEPAARGWHARGQAETLHKRSASPALEAAQRHALKNRYLMMLKDDTLAGVAADLPFILAGDVARFGYLLLRRPSLLSAYGDVWRLRRRMVEKRRHIQGRRVVADHQIRSWFR